MTQVLQRPNVMQSSPSPTSIIASINQSNYLCSQAPDPAPQSSSSSQYKEDDMFLRPTKNSIRGAGMANRNTLFKQVVIVQQAQNSRVQQNTAQNNYDMNGVNREADKSFKINDNAMQNSEKSENYDFKNLVINSGSKKFCNNPLVYINQQTNKNEYYDQDVKIDEYSTSKPKYFFTNNGVIPHNDTNQNFTSNYGNNYNRNEIKTHVKSEDVENENKMNINSPSDSKRTTDTNK